jgi:hypothetical protein
MQKNWIIFDYKQLSFMTTIMLKGIPEDLAKFILKIQWDLKVEKGRGQLHQSQAVLHIIKEYKKLIEK